MLEHTAEIPTLLSPKARGGSKEPLLVSRFTTRQPKAAEWLIPKRPCPPREEVIGKIRHLFRDRIIISGTMSS
jgi:hypothetical protein